MDVLCESTTTPNRAADPTLRRVSKSVLFIRRLKGKWQQLCPGANQWKSEEIKGNQRNQRKSKEIKGNQRKSIEITEI